MSIPVALERLREEVDRFGPVVYLLTTSADGRPHAVAVAVRWTDDGQIAMEAGRRTRGNVADRPAVSLLWPAQDSGAYTLIVDGHGSVGADGGEVAVIPTKGVLHRPVADPPVEPAPGCTADCVPLYRNPTT